MIDHSKVQSYLVFCWWLLVVVLLLGGTISGTLVSILVNIIAIVTLPALFLSRLRRHINREPIVWLFGLSFVVVSLMFVINAENWSDLSYIANFAPLVLAIPVYAIARSIAGQRTASILSVLFIAGALVALAVALADVYVFELSRAGGILTNQLVFARLALTIGFVAAFGFMIRGNGKKYFFLFGPLLGIAVLILAGSRGAMVAVPFLLLLLLGFVIFLQKQNVGRILFVFAGAIGLAAAAIIYLTPNPQRFLDIINLVPQVLTGGEGLDRSIQIRIEFYVAGWELFLSSPWTGYGWANLSAAAFSILDAAKYDADLVRYFHFHNDFINIAVAAGIPGVLAWMSWLAAPVIGALASPKDRYFHARLYVCLAIVIAYLIAGLTDVTFGYDMPTTAYAMITAIVLGAVREKKPA